jgi:hypothetical protein
VYGAPTLQLRQMQGFQEIRRFRADYVESRCLELRFEHGIRRALPEAATVDKMLRQATG